MSLAIYKIPCNKCGAECERCNNTRVAICYTCKKKRSTDWTNRVKNGIHTPKKRITASGMEDRRAKKDIYLMDKADKMADSDWWYWPWRHLIEAANKS